MKQLNDFISTCFNKNFVYCDELTTREEIIKKFDSNIKTIPLLSKKKELLTVYSIKDFPINAERNVIARSKSPVRISFGGGGSDLTHYFTKSSGGAVINSTISLYSHATLIKNPNDEIIIISEDLNETLKANDLKLALKQKNKMGLIMSIIELINPKFGFKLHISSDFPVGSGLGGSAVVMSAIIGCFNEFRIDKWTKYEIAEMAYQAERLTFNISGGWQDQYAAVFGGFNFIEFHPDENIVSPIRLHSKIALELEESLLLCDTGIGHHSGNIHNDQKESMSSEVVQKLVAESVELTYSTRKYLLRGDLVKFGQCLDTAWRLKRNFSSLISNDHLDALYNGAIENGALGGKLLGAGGGGFFIFYVTPFKKHTLMSYLKSKNLTIQPFRFEPDGLKTWTSRESEKLLIEEQKN